MRFALTRTTCDCQRATLVVKPILSDSSVSRVSACYSVLSRRFLIQLRFLLTCDVTRSLHPSKGQHDSKPLLITGGAIIACINWPKMATKLMVRLRWPEGPFAGARCSPLSPVLRRPPPRRLPRRRPHRHDAAHSRSADADGQLSGPTASRRFTRDSACHCLRRQWRAVGRRRSRR